MRRSSSISPRSSSSGSIASSAIRPSIASSSSRDGPPRRPLGRNARSFAPCPRSWARGCAKSPIPNFAPAWSRLPRKLKLVEGRRRWEAPTTRPFPRSFGANEPMKTGYLICAVAALVPLAACNKGKESATKDTSAAAYKPVPPPADGDWTQIVTPTPAGGFMMGNPVAKVHLIEYGALTCPHCRAFDETGVTPLINTYVKTGKVSYEFRNYLLSAMDLAPSLIARCNGAKSFFALTRALYTDQPEWVGKV